MNLPSRDFAHEALADWTGGRWTCPPEGGIGGFSIDTRTLKPGDLFVALKTERRDGHDFLEDARRGGAAAALVSRPIPANPLPQLVVGDPLAALQEISRRHRQRFAAPVISVTGSAGKTSTKDLLALLLGTEAEVLKTEGNLNNQLGAPLTLLRIEPGSHRFAVVEAGLRKPGDLEELGRLITPDHTVVTLIAPAHLEGMGSLEAIAKEKTALSRHARPGGFAVFPHSASLYPELFEHGLISLVVAPVESPDLPGHRIIRFSTEFDAGETCLRLHTDGRTDRLFRAPLLSPGLAQNAVLALTLASALGVPDALLAQRLRLWKPSALRGQRIRFPQGLLYLDCYNANPAAMVDSLTHFEHVSPPEERRLYIVGTMGELGPESSAWHRRTGARLRLRPGDRLLVIGEEAGDFCEGARTSGAAEASVCQISDLDAIRRELAGFRGSVFIKGSRRHALESVLTGTPFDPPPNLTPREASIPC
jgi:UDP-N-acetylmuramoyl-tripeptide--D-alanyl-D-alanine ligase